MIELTELDCVTLDAQYKADISGRSVAILNLNRYSPLYVVRTWDDRFIGATGLVKRIDPIGK